MPDSKGTVELSKWFIGLVITAISIVSGWLIHNYENELTDCHKREAQKDSMLIDCTNKRYQELIHRADRDRQQLENISTENKRRFDSVISNQHAGLSNMKQIMENQHKILKR